MPDDSPSRQRHTIKMPKHIIPADAIVVNKELGTGEFGVVQQGVWTNEEGHRVRDPGTGLMALADLGIVAFPFFSVKYKCTRRLCNIVKID